MKFQPGEGIAALIFDIDGTLLDTMTVHYQAWRETLVDYGIDLDRAWFDRFAGQTSSDIVALLNEETEASLDAGELSMIKDQAFVRHVPLIQPIHAVREIAEHYAARMPLGLATNEHFGVANIVMRSSGLAALFQAMVTADEVEHPKPAPDMFVECARRLGVSPAACHVFEDSSYGIEAARAAGMSVTNVREI